MPSIHSSPHHHFETDDETENETPKISEEEKTNMIIQNDEKVYQRNFLILRVNVYILKQSELWGPLCMFS